MLLSPFANRATSKLVSTHRTASFSNFHIVLALPRAGYQHQYHQRHQHQLQLRRIAASTSNLRQTSNSGSKPHNNSRHLHASTPIAMAPQSTSAGAGGAQAQHTNRLVSAKSPYLIHHANDPVDWYEWGNEAFQEAQKTGKVVFLSIGYSRYVPFSRLPLYEHI